MQEPEDFIDERLRRLADRTAAVRPSAGFDDWIVSAVERESGVVWFDAMWRAGRVALVAGALAAAASVVLAMYVRSGMDEQVLATFEMVELDE